MKRYCSNLNKELPTIVLLSHGMLAEALLQSASLIAGEIENIAYLRLDEGDSPQEFKNEMRNLLNSLPQKKIVMLDLLGGTPCNTFASLVRDLESEVFAIAGMNLPMLLEVISSRRDMVDLELADCAEEIGKEGICNINERFSIFVRSKEEEK